MGLKQYSLSYHHDSALLYEAIKQMRWPIMLDSGQFHSLETKQPASQFGRYDILVANPVMTFVTCGAETEITYGNQRTTSQDDPFALLSRTLIKTKAARSAFPFTGGMLGYFGYDLGRRIENLPVKAQNDTEMPEMMVGLYDWAVVVDHKLQTTTLVSHQFYLSDEEWHDLCQLFSKNINVASPKSFSCEPWHSNFNQVTYAHAFDTIQKYIQAGDCYQVNLAQRFSARVRGDSWICYQKLRKLSPAPFMAFMDMELRGERMQILSVSPERFLQLIDRNVETRPIKGTRPRSTDEIVDKNNAMELSVSLKDRAENVMIVDLLRNDIGKVCETGSVKAERLFQLQSFANVHHLVSTVTGKLDATKTGLDLLRSCFPGGSITGAPKLRAMEIIEELEPHRRGVYCGAIGYVGFDGDMDTNIAIRTAVIKNQQIYFYAGGGIVADSEPEREYTETMDKASNFLSMLAFFMNANR